MSSPPSTPPASAPAVQDLRRQAEAARESGAWAAAIAKATEAVRATPADSAGWVELALALLAARRNDEAHAAAVQAAAADGESPAALRALALTLLARRALEPAQAAVAAALRIAPRYPEGLATLALIRMMTGKTQEADALFRHALSLKGDMAETLGNHAALLAQTGREQEALETVDRALALKPFLPAAHGLRGGLLRRAGRFAEAAAAFAQALAHNPEAAPDAHANHADALRQAGQTQAAVAAARAGLDRHPGHPALLANLGTALQADGQTEAARAAYEAALRAAPDLAEAENNLARLHLDAGRGDLALDLLRRAFNARPSDPDIARNFAALALDRGDGDAATTAAAARTAAKAAPQDPEALLLLGRALLRVKAAGEETGEEAERMLLAAVQNAGTRADVRLRAATALLRGGRRAAAIAAARQLCRLAPGEARHWALLGQCLRRIRFTAADDSLRADLAAAFAQPGADNAHLVDAAVSVVLLCEPMARLAAAAANSTAANPAAPNPTAPNPTAAIRELLEAGALRPLAGDPLLAALLTGVAISDPGFERLLTALRRALLAGAERADPAALDDPAWLPLICALADQCFLNEYAFAEDETERAATAALSARLQTVLAAGAAPSPARLALLAAYRPLFGWPGGDLSAAGADWPEPFARLLARHVGERAEEEAIKAALPALTPVENPVSAAVRAQYEESPYPRWRQAGLLDRPIAAPAAVRAMFPHVAFAPDELAPGSPWDRPDVLVAGCGAGREAVWARNHFKGARVLAVDVSRASLAYAARQSRSLGPDIVYAQADILRLGEALGADGRRFDMIHCVGVLHHMDDPLAGWTVLRRLLAPRGLMKIGLYSRRARAPLAPVREFIAAGGYAAAPDDVRRFRRDALALPDDHPAKIVRQIPDFYSVSACRDLLFHVREHVLSLPEIAVWLETLELELLGLHLEDPTLIEAYRTRFPHDPTMTDLAAWDRFEAEFPHAFGELYQLWLRPRA